MCDDKVVATSHVDEPIGARAFDATERVTALLKACGRGFEVERPYMDAARRNAQSAVRAANERRIQSL
jgi:hypothetical protein